MGQGGALETSDLSALEATTLVVRNIPARYNQAPCIRGGVLLRGHSTLSVKQQSCWQERLLREWLPVPRPGFHLVGLMGPRDLQVVRDALAGR